MAGWSELLEESLPEATNHVCVIVGELSSLVWDKVHTALQAFELAVRVKSEQDLSFSITSVGTKAAYLLVDPSEDVLNAAEALVRGRCSETFFILISDKPPEMEYLKSKAKQHRAYYTITPPKTEPAKAKMASYFQLRWGCSREGAWEACTLLDFSPGRLYYFDTLYRSATKGRVLPSSTSQAIIYNILGHDSPNTVVANIIEGREVESTYTATFNQQVIRAMLNVVVDAKIVRASIDRGHSSQQLAVRDTGLTQFQVNRAFRFAEATSMRGLIHRERILRFSLENAEQPEVLSILAHTFRGE